MVEGLIDELLRREQARRTEQIQPIMMLVDVHGSPLNIKGTSPLLDPGGNLFRAQAPWPALALQVRTAALGGRPIEHRCILRDGNGTPRTIRADIAPMSPTTAMVILREEQIQASEDHPLINMAALALDRYVEPIARES